MHDSDSTTDSVARGATSGSASSRTPHFRASQQQHQRIQGLLAKASTVASSYSLGSNNTFAALVPAQGHGWAGIPCVYLCVCFVSLAWLRYCASMLLMLVLIAQSAAADLAAVAAWWGVKAAAENEISEDHRAVHVFDALAMNGIQETRKRPIPCGS
jgi:hypothetical protein